MERYPKYTSEVKEESTKKTSKYIEACLDFQL